MEPGVQRQVTASSSRPPPSQSILRKPRPSHSGPRPTPRFDLPTGYPSDDDGGETAKRTDVTGYDGSVVEEENKSTASATDDATTSSVGGGGNNKSTSSRSENNTPKPSSFVDSSKATTSKEETRKPVKPKPGKKKFAVTASGAAKKRPIISRRTVSHSSQGSHSSVGSEPGPSKPSRQPQSTQIVEEDEANDDLLPVDNMSASVSPANDRSSAEPLQTYQQSFVQTHTYRNVPLSDKAAGKQPSRPLYSSQMERTSSQASESTVVSSISGSTAASATTGILPDAPLGSATSAMPGSTSAPPVGSLHLPPARLESSPVQASGSIVSPASSSVLEMPMTSRNFPVAHRPSPSSGSLVRPGGGLTRQSTMPYERSSAQRQQITRGGSTTSLALMRSPTRANPPSSAFIGQGSAAAPGMSSPPSSFAAPLMGRSISQDSYGSRLRPLLRQYPSPKLGPMRSATVAAPSMVAVSGQFMDPEGPDTFSIYSKTSLDDNEEDEEDGPELSSFKGDSGSSSFLDPQVTQRPLFTPTRPTQTPRIPFARTRSQLNVILDREKERLGEGNYNSWNESRGSRDHDSQRRGS